MKRSIKPAAGHWFSWRPRSYIPARSSTSCYTLCKTFFPTVRTTIRLLAIGFEACFFATAERTHDNTAKNFAYIANDRLHLVCDTKLQKYKHGAGHGFDIIRQKIRRFGDIYLLAKFSLREKCRMEYRSFDKFFIMYNTCVLYNCMYE